MPRDATIIADASFCHKSGAAGWAVWITLSPLNGKLVERVKKSGGFKDVPTSAEVAERWACYNGLFLAAQAGADYALVQTDCLNIVNAKGERDFVNKVWLPTFPTLRRITWRHVKGHTTFKDARYYVNRWCDANAKQEMRKRRNVK